MFWPFKRKRRRVVEERPDFSSVDSAEKAEQLCGEGTLEQMLLVPIEFGGVDVPVNYVYVPVGVADIKRQIDENMIRDMVKKGTVKQYGAAPEYAETSVVPIAVTVRGWDPGEFKTRIRIWGNA
jgi:hypothetical protein